MSAAALCFLLLLGAAPATQNQSAPKPPKPSAESTQPEDSPNNPSTPAKLLKWQYDATLKDIDRLQKLTLEIKQDMEKAGENVLPLTTLKKLEEVERLSRKIRGRIKQ